MIAYIDSSVLLRILLQQANALSDWASIQVGISRGLLRVECHRSLDRLWHAGALDDAQFVEKRRTVEAFLTRLKLLDIDEHVLELATTPLTTALATLDALHLTTAAIYRSTMGADEPPLFLATHDRALAKAAREMHFPILGP